MTICGIENFKMKLDKFLESVPDEPNVRGLVPGACTAEAIQLNPGPSKEGPQEKSLKIVKYLNENTPMNI